MASKRELIGRWNTEDGRRRAAAIMTMLRERSFDLMGKEDSGVTLDESIRPRLSLLLSGFSFTEEVSPALDLRGLEFEGAVHLVDIDLGDVQLDFATLGGSIWGCRARRASLKNLRAVNKSIQYDFRNACFDGASLKGCHFTKTILDGARFLGAKLQTAWFSDASCRGVNFCGADMRLAECPRADFSGADLAGVDMTEATMGGVRFDQSTKLARTILRGASMSDDFQDYADRSGAILGPEPGLLMLASLDGTKKLLELENADGSLDRALADLVLFRERLQKDPSFDWMSELLRRTPPELAATVEFAISQGAKDVSSQLD